MADEPLSPEQEEQLRAYGAALQGIPAAQMQQAGNLTPFLNSSPWRILLGALQGIQSRSALDTANRSPGIRRTTVYGTSAPSPGSVPTDSTVTAPTSLGLSTGGEPTSYSSRVAEIEAGGNPRLYSPSRRYRGLGQFSTDLENQYGITDWTDSTQQHRAINQYAQDNARTFRARFGRDPSPGELYLMHQQGAGGGMALLSSPNETAFDVLMRLPYYNGNSVTVQSAIQNNLPRQLRGQWRTITAGAFANQWISRFMQGYQAPQPPPQSPPVGQSSPGTQAPLITPRTVRTFPITPGQDDGMMRLGGPQGDTSGPKGPQLPSGPPIPEGQDLSAPLSGQLRPGQGQSTPQIPPEITSSIPLTRPTNTFRIQQLERMLSRADLLTDADAQKYRTEYDQLIGPQTEPLRDIGRAVYDGRTGRLLRVFPDAHIASQIVGNISTPIQLIPNVDARGQVTWRITDMSGRPVQPSPGGGQGQSALEKATADLRAALDSGNAARIRAAYDAYNRQAGSQQSLQTTQDTLRDDAVKNAADATTQRTNLRALQEALRGTSWTGPGTDRVTAIRRVLANLHVSTQAELNRLSEQELVDMLSARIGVGTTRTLTSRPTQWDFQRLSGIVPGLTQSSAGARLMVDYMLQEVEHSIGLGRVLAHPTGQYVGKSPDEVIELYHRTNPIILSIPQHRDANGQTRQPFRLWTGPVDENTYASIPSGTRYQHPDDTPGTLRVKP